MKYEDQISFLERKPTKYVRNVFIERKNVPPGKSSDPFCSRKFQFNQQKYQQSKSVQKGSFLVKITPREACNLLESLAYAI